MKKGNSLRYNTKMQQLQNRHFLLPIVYGYLNPFDLYKYKILETTAVNECD